MSDALVQSPHEFILAVTAEWHVARAQNATRAILEQLDFSRVPSAYIVTAVSELASNLFFHTSDGGLISFVCRSSQGGYEVTLISQDEGPGIPDLEQALLDGFSTNGGLGGGLPGVERLMDDFRIESALGSGTRVECRKWSSCK